MRYRIKSTKLTLKIIAWLQIVGGVSGLGAMGYAMLKIGTVTGAVLLLLFVGIGLFSFSIYCGRKLITEIHNSRRIIFSIINQFLQIFQWSFLGYGLTYSSGLSLTFGVERSGYVFNFSMLLSYFNMSINSGDDAYLKLNLIALLIILILFDILSERKKEISNQQSGII